MVIQERVDSPQEGDRELYEVMAVLYEAMAYKSLAALRHTLRLRTTAMNLRARDGNGWRAWQRATDIAHRTNSHQLLMHPALNSPETDDGPLPTEAAARTEQESLIRSLQRNPEYLWRMDRAFQEQCPACALCALIAHEERPLHSLEHGLTEEVRSEMDGAFMADDVSPDTGIHLPEGPRRGAVSEPSRGAASPNARGRKWDSGAVDQGLSLRRARLACRQLTGDRNRRKRHSGRYSLHLVFQGHVVGTFNEWSAAKVSLTGYPGSANQGFHTEDECIDAWQAMCGLGIHPHAVDPGSASASTAVPPKLPALSEQGAQKRRGKGEIAALQVSSHHGVDSASASRDAPQTRGETPDAGDKTSPVSVNFAIRGAGIVSSSP
ncbi:hypothetical protein DFH09DRAFT_1074565 [Mycena vulgaris]|nr:hypothetical protein DFH09DRAFT_1074565 [Mycena vulgaris]